MKFIALTALVFISTILNLHAQVPRAIVIEDHTGAWCGWCVRGNQASEELHAQYGNQLIPLAFHNNDSMALAIQDTLAKKFKISGYPSGLLNRESYTIGTRTSNIIDPDNWTDVAASVKDAKSSVDVSVTWSIDNATGILTATVTADLLTNLTTQYAFNLVVCEDSVTGKGDGWDQTNYLSGRSGYESSPYYYMPSHVTDFYHMNVVRAFLGGPNGDIGTFPAAPMKGQKYTCTFSVDCSTLKIQHREHLWVAGIVLEHGGLNRIVNAVANGKKPTPKSTLWKVGIQATDNYRQAQTGDSTVFDVVLTNPNDSAVLAIPDVDKTNSMWPSDWSVRFSPRQVLIPAHDSAHVSLIVKLGSKVGYAGCKLFTQIKPFANIRSLPLSTNVGVLSNKARYAVAKFDSDQGTDLEPLLASYQQLSSYPDATAILNVNDSTIKHYDFNQFDVLILPESYTTRTSVIFSKKMIEMLQSRIDHYRPSIMTSPMDMWFTADNYGSVVTSDVKKFFNETLGFTGAKRSWGPWLWNSSLRRSEIVGVRAFDDSQVASGMNFNVNETDSTYTIQDHWLDELSIIDSANVHRILNFYGPMISNDSSVGAVWTKLKNTAFIYQGFGFEAIKDEPVRRTLLANYLAFLQQITDVEPGTLNSAAIHVEPNPTSEVLSVRFVQRSPQSSIRLVDLTGREYYRSTSNALGDVNLRFRLTDLCDGAYYLMIDDGGVYSIAPVIVRR